MPRDHAIIHTDMWGDDHWRSLTPGAQWLYQLLLTSPSLSHVGVADWRPGRIAQLARGLNADGVRKYAAELARERFIAVDDSTEEVLVRSFLRHDGVLVNPNMWKSVGSAFAGVFSPTLKGIVANEAVRLRDEHPDGIAAKRGGVVCPWQSKHLATMLKSASATPTPSPTERGSDRGSDTPSPQGVTPGAVPSTPTPTPRNASHSSARAKSKSREVTIPKDWAPTAEHIARAQSLQVDVISEAENFRLHAEAHDRRAVNWNAAFTMWLKKAKPALGASVRPVDDVRDGFLFVGGTPALGGPPRADGVKYMTSEQRRAWLAARDEKQRERFAEVRSA